MTELGQAAALELAQLLADMEACETAAEFCDLYSHMVVDVSPTEKRIRFASSNHEIALRSGHPTHPQPPATITDWSRTTRLRIVSIEVCDG
ncbi:MAG: hypothetical protein AB1586_04405 [Pseudomonadota bacterium]